MAKDYVVSSDAPYVDIRVLINGAEEKVKALLDTGYTGELIIPKDFIVPGSPVGRHHADITLGDDTTIVHAPLYLGELEIIGLPPIRAVAISIIGDEYVIGRGILDEFEVTFDHGKRVVVKP